MSTDDNELGPVFVECQRERLEALRDQILGDTIQASAEERDLSQRFGDEVQNSCDEDAIETRRDVANAFGAEGERRPGEIRRALERIVEDSYDLSDDSGEPIPPARLGKRVTLSRNKRSTSDDPLQQIATTWLSPSRRSATCNNVN